MPHIELPDSLGRLQCCSLLRDGKTRCPNWGLPEGEFDFFTCEGCLNYLEECLETEARKLYVKHANN